MIASTTCLFVALTEYIQQKTGNIYYGADMLFESDEENGRSELVNVRVSTDLVNAVRSLPRKTTVEAVLDIRLGGQYPGANLISIRAI